MKKFAAEIDKNKIQFAYLKKVRARFSFSIAPRRRFARESIRDSGIDSEILRLAIPDCRRKKTNLFAPFATRIPST